MSKPELTTEERNWILEHLANQFSISDLKTLAFSLGVDYELFTFGNKVDLSRELITYFENRNAIGSLLKETQRERPNSKLTRLQEKFPPQLPSRKIQITLDSNVLFGFSNFLNALAAQLGLNRNDVTLVAIAATNGSILLLVSLLTNLELDKKLFEIHDLEDGKYHVISIVFFNSLDSTSQEAWSLVAQRHQLRQEGTTLQSTVTWKKAVDSVSNSPEFDNDVTKPKIIEHYEIKELLGKGGMAHVYRAYDPRTRRDVAIKVIKGAGSGNSSFQENFQSELKHMIELEHFAIVHIYDAGEYEGQPYLAMRLMRGGSLRDRLHEERVFSPAEVSVILRRLVDALKSAHEKKIVHCDLKPSNVLVDANGDVYLADFGIARMMKQKRNMSSTSVGTPEYMAPEQWNNKTFDQRTDIYQLGVMLFEMLTGQRPFQANDVATLMDKHLREDIPSAQAVNPELPLACDNVLNRAMAKDPNERYATLDNLVTAFARAFGEDRIHDRYQVKEEIGHRRISTVYLVYDPQTGKECALKIFDARLRNNLASRRTFNTAKSDIVKLEHETIVPVYRIDLHQSRPYLVMRRMHSSLHERVQPGTPLALDDVFRVANRVATALDVAHKQGIIHGDVKPSNILYDSEGMPYLSNFGSITIAEQTNTEDANLRSFSYMAPEQWRAEILSPQTDIYQFGVLLFELLTGRRPYEDEGFDKLRHRHLDEAVPAASSINSSLPPEYDTLLARAMAKKPEARFSEASELAEALTKAKKQFTLQSYYEAGLHHYRNNEWQSAINSFEEVVKICSDYAHANDYLERAGDYQNKTKTLRQGQAALNETQWKRAIELLTPLGEFRGANVDLAESKRQLKLVNHYQEGIAQQQQRNWLQAQKIFGEIDANEPNYQDVDIRRNEVNQEIETLLDDANEAYKNKDWQIVLKNCDKLNGLNQADAMAREAVREKRLEALYKDGIKAEDQEDWKQAKKCYHEIVSFEPGYKDALTRLDRWEIQKAGWRRYFNIDLRTILIIMIIVLSISLIAAMDVDLSTILPSTEGSSSLTDSVLIENDDLDNCIETAVSILQVNDDNTQYGVNTPIDIDHTIVEFENNLLSETCPNLREEVYYTWETKETAAIKVDSSNRFRATYIPSKNAVSDILTITIEYLESGKQNQFEYELSFNN